MNREMAEFLLKDLARWTFGSLVASRASFNALQPGEPTDALRRFARGKAFKYGRRVLMLWERHSEL